jgi:hypothetical protein
MKVNSESGKPRASYECTVERVADGWRADAVLRDHIGLIVERQVRDAPTQIEAIEAATDALSTRWSWR